MSVAPGRLQARAHEERHLLCHIQSMMHEQKASSTYDKEQWGYIILYTCQIG